MKKQCSHDLQEMITTVVKPIETALHDFIVGQEEAVHHTLLSLLSVGQRDFNVKEKKPFSGCGHILFIGPTGSAKTVLCKKLASLIGGDYKRVQGTPDLLATDITGFELLTLRPGVDETLKFREGPIFANILLFDEVNRVPPKANAGPLEAMAEGTVTHANQTYKLPEPFLVLANMNPSEQGGTFQLHEAFSDRILFCVLMDEATEDEHVAIARKTEKLEEMSFDSVTTPEIMNGIRMLIFHQVRETDEVLRYIARINCSVNNPRSLGLFAKERAELGSGSLFLQRPPLNPRTTIFLRGAARAQAALNYRDYVIPDDIRAVLPAVLRSRLSLLTEGALFALTSEDGDLMYRDRQDLVSGLIREVKNKVPVVV
ncbi:MAG: MoxR family ATPase [Patescibacteria group bacterium]